jgi:hypothetical protein
MSKLIFIRFYAGEGMIVRVKIGYWTLDVGHWQFLFGFVPGEGGRQSPASSDHVSGESSRW